VGYHQPPPASITTIIRHNSFYVAGGGQSFPVRPKAGKTDSYTFMVMEMRLSVNKNHRRHAHKWQDIPAFGGGLGVLKVRAYRSTVPMVFLDFAVPLAPCRHLQ
jgi:hypothetical protein